MECAPNSQIVMAITTAFTTAMQAMEARLVERMAQTEAKIVAITEQNESYASRLTELQTQMTMMMDLLRNLQSMTRRWSDVSYLLGGWHNERTDGPWTRRRGDPKVIKAVITFVRATGRLLMEA